LKTDILYTNDILYQVKIDPLHALVLVKENFTRLGGFLVDNPYRKVPRDVMRVGVLNLCSLINKQIVEMDQDKDKLMALLLGIYEGLKLLDKEDPHRV
jgi:hypothetical protein